MKYEASMKLIKTRLLDVIYRFINQFYSSVERCLRANAAILSFGNVFSDHRSMVGASLVRTLR
jgi:hypothetical protein